jgi:hypothetical protein
MTERRSKVEMLPVLMFTRGPETPEEQEQFDGMEDIWKNLWRGVGRQVAKDQKQAAPGTEAAVYLIQRYSETIGLETPDDAALLAKAIIQYATREGWPHVDQVNPRSFTGLVRKAREGWIDANRR